VHRGDELEATSKVRERRRGASGSIEDDGRQSLRAPRRVANAAHRSSARRGNATGESAARAFAFAEACRAPVDKLVSIFDEDAEFEPRAYPRRERRA
jgi:hypothetical protein